MFHFQNTKKKTWNLRELAVHKIKQYYMITLDSLWLQSKHGTEELLIIKKFVTYGLLMAYKYICRNNNFKIILGIIFRKFKI